MPIVWLKVMIVECFRMFRSKWENQGAQTPQTFSIFTVFAASIEDLAVVYQKLSPQWLVNPPLSRSIYLIAEFIAFCIWLALCPLAFLREETQHEIQYLKTE